MFAAFVLAGCAAPSGQRAPVIDHSFSSGGAANTTSRPANVMPVQREREQHEPDWRPQVYVVQKGDTLYSIAFNFGFDYHELAELNGIQDPAVIKAGQEIRLFAGVGAAPAGRQVAEAKAAEDIKSQPVVSKLPYSEQAMAQIEKMQAEPKKVEVKPPPIVKQPPETVVAAGSGMDETLRWEMPASGKVSAWFSEGDGRKGIDIAGKLGQAVSASAAGKVVYSGSGLRGYGKLIIIKHNNTYLSAYAHNDKLLVKEGQLVAKGQKIAEMGNSDADRVALHFEIRRLGKPVDPAKYLPLQKS